MVFREVEGLELRVERQKMREWESNVRSYWGKLKKLRVERKIWRVDSQGKAGGGMGWWVVSERVNRVNGKRVPHFYGMSNSF
jgi:hypothetical protein